MALEDRGPLFISLFTVGTVFAILIVALRFWVRVRIVRTITPDDWIMLASLTLTLAAYGCLAAAVRYGLGQHHQFLTPERSRIALKLLWTALCITPSAQAAAKISISVMLINITTSVRWKRFLRGLIVLFIAITVLTLFGVLLQCRPVELLWDPSVGGSCHRMTEAVIFYIQGGGGALYDVILATSPILLLWNVQLDVRKKLLVCGLLALGYITSLCGILRSAHTPGALTQADITFTVMEFMIWKTVELSLSIIVGCLPTLRPLFDKRTKGGITAEPSHQAQDDRHVLTESDNERRTRQTASVHVDFPSSLRRGSSCQDGSSSKTRSSSKVNETELHRLV